MTPAVHEIVFGEPWVMHPEKLSMLAARLRAITPAELSAARARSDDRGAPPVRMPYVMHGSTAEIHVNGVLMKSVPWIYEFFGIEACCTGDLSKAVARAAADPNVKAIALRIDSGGGQVAGVLEASDAIYAAAQEKKVSAFVEGMAASGAYWLASQATEISATEDAFVGSIGVYQVHEDLSAAADKAGVKVHVVKSGEHKGMGVPGAPISAEQLAGAQEEVDGLAAIFNRAVVRGRSPSGIVAKDMKTLANGQVWLAKDAKDKGLVDRIEPAGAGFSRLLTEVDAMTKEELEKQEKAKAEAKAQADAAVAADRKRSADLRAAFPDDLTFAMAQYDAGATVEQASVAYLPIMREKLAKAATAPAPAATKPAGPTGAPPMRSSGDPAGAPAVDFISQAKALASEEKIPLRSAMSRIARRNPKAHEAFVNSGQENLSAIKKRFQSALEHGPAALEGGAR